MTTSTPAPAAAIPRNAARLSIAAVIAYQTLLIALIFLRPDLHASWQTISEWAIGPLGWLMVLAFLLSALSYGSLFMTVRSQVRGFWGTLGLVLLAVCALGTVGVGVLTTDPMPLTSKTHFTVHGILHVICGGSAMVLLPWAALLLTLNLARRNPEWRAVRRPLLWTAFVPLLGFASFVTHLALVVVPMGEEAYGPGVPLGWPPRFLFMSYGLWVVTLAAQAIRLQRIASGEDAETGAHRLA